MPHQQHTHQAETTVMSPTARQVATPVAETRLADPTPAPPIQRAEQPNRTGLPDNLKSGIESLSGYSMDDVRVHYNSSSPAQLNAHAYAQGTDIHVAPGQERHLPHEAWHVVQQKQGRVKATRQLRSKVAINDDPGLEKEADVMGARALQRQPTLGTFQQQSTDRRVTQRRTQMDETGHLTYTSGGKERDQAVGERIATLKAQALNFIARRIKYRAAHATEAPPVLDWDLEIAKTPHVAVIQSGTTFHLAINSISGTVENANNVRDQLKIYGDEALNELKVQLTSHLPASSAEKSTHTAENRLAHWVDKRKETTAYAPSLKATKKGGVEHGEMQILHALDQGEANKQGTVRVLWVGGTKTPCYDCDHSMSPIHAKNEANEGGQGEPKHHDLSVLKINDERRRPYAPFTGSDGLSRGTNPVPVLDRGAAFGNWKAVNASEEERRRTKGLTHQPAPHATGRVKGQDQDTADLAALKGVKLPAH